LTTKKDYMLLCLFCKDLFPRRDPMESRNGKGFFARILHVDLRSGGFSLDQPDEGFYRNYLGGLGLGARILWERMPAGADPFGEEAIVGFTTGLLTDTGALFAGRYTVVGKSPATGGWGDANSGGYFAPALKRCGLDAVFFHGRSDRPVYLYLDEKGPSLLDASDLWGTDAILTEEILKKRHGKRAQCACIGPAGERLSFMAGVCTDRGRLAARAGLGAIMGSKRLKAIVAAGRIKPQTAFPERIRELSSQFKKRLEKGRVLEKAIGDRLLHRVGWMTRKSPIYMRQPSELFRAMLRKYGTSSMTVLSAEGGDSPVKNWAGVGYRDFPFKASSLIGAEAVCSRETKKYGCFSCPLKCGGIVNLPQESGAAAEMHRPEYETICAFGTLLLNSDLDSIFTINDMLNRAGMDTISCGATVAFAIECFERGILTEKDTDGLILSWGDALAIHSLAKMIIERKGIGDILADGVKKAAERIGGGSEDLAVHCGGIEPPMHDPKFDPGFGMAYLCDPVPGRHMVYSIMLMDLERLDRAFPGVKTPPAFMPNKSKYALDGRYMALGCCFRMLVDCAGCCAFGTQVGGDIPLVEWLNAATGWDLTPEDYLKTGERVEQLRHAFNLREGINARRHFRLHPRLTGEPPLDCGPSKGVTLDQDEAANAFYNAMGWDLETGLPSRDRLISLGLEDVAGTLATGKGGGLILKGKDNGK
jgi:aldehyde:ferredoxin oxidoreductase